MGVLLFAIWEVPWLVVCSSVQERLPVGGVTGSGVRDKIFFFVILMLYCTVGCIL